ncbi:hypothetical protein C8R43DRAFT_89294 [Mycena crocata]|nr:hypothetical protein C8R43DRAFT_89294 [Mycena crocata]
MAFLFVIVENALSITCATCRSLIRNPTPSTWYRRTEENRPVRKVRKPERVLPLLVFLSHDACNFTRTIDRTHKIYSINFR